MRRAGISWLQLMCWTSWRPGFTWRLYLAALQHATHQAAPPVGAGVDASRSLLLAGRAISEGGYFFLLEQERALAFPLIVAYLGNSDPEVAETCAALVEHLQRVPGKPLRVVVLGGLQVWRGRQQLKPRAFRRRAAELFALLLFNGRPRSEAQGQARTLAFERIAEALWPGKDMASVRVPFHHATSALRRALEPDLPEKFPSRYLEVNEGQVVLWLPPGSSVDVDRFEDCCERQDWEAALACYADELLPELLYADWTVLPRQRLTQLYQRALLAAARQRFDAGEYPRALDACQCLIALEPWQEQAVLLGMQACLKLGDKAGALRWYHNLQSTLKEELGVEPQNELTALYLSLIKS
jgi:LuxR family maltose regulon positive regulatory protein